MKACKIYIDNTEDSKSVKIEFGSVLLSFEFYRLNWYLKIAFQGTVSEFNEPVPLDP